MNIRADFRHGERGYGFVSQGKVYLQRCGDCQRENYGPAVASGQCAWCGGAPDLQVPAPANDGAKP